MGSISLSFLLFLFSPLQAKMKQLLVSVPVHQVRYYDAKNDILLYQKNRGDLIFVHKNQVKTILKATDQLIETAQITKDLVALRIKQIDHAHSPQYRYFAFDLNDFKFHILNSENNLIFSRFKKDFFEINYQQKKIFKQSILGNNAGPLANINFFHQSETPNTLQLWEKSPSEIYFTDTNNQQLLGLFFIDIKKPNSPNLLFKMDKFILCPFNDQLHIIDHKKNAFSLKGEVIEAMKLPQDTIKMKCAPNIGLLAETRQQELFLWSHQKKWLKAADPVRLEQIVIFNRDELFAFIPPHLYLVEWVL